MDSTPLIHYHLVADIIIAWNLQLLGHFAASLDPLAVTLRSSRHKDMAGETVVEIYASSV